MKLKPIKFLTFFLLFSLILGGFGRITYAAQKTVALQPQPAVISLPNVQVTTEAQASSVVVAVSSKTDSCAVQSPTQRSTDLNLNLGLSTNLTQALSMPASCFTLAAGSFFTQASLAVVQAQNLQTVAVSKAQVVFNDIFREGFPDAREVPVTLVSAFAFAVIVRGRRKQKLVAFFENVNNNLEFLKTLHLSGFQVLRC